MKKVEIHYQNNQLVEALCEIQFEPNQKWDWTIPGLFYNNIKEKFPKKQEVRGFGVGFQFDSSNNENFPIQSNTMHKIEGIQFLNEERNRLIYIRENSISDSFPGLLRISDGTCILPIS